MERCPITSMDKFCHPSFAPDKIYSNWKSYFGLRPNDVHGEIA
ncbi:hypothetical protein PPN31119_01161 [Pandoraea pnomenusa]|jgi:hypothetical protein|uniref:Uncharacterized protein n=1 Tax=Pandoraea pnomenusa TaxID=93220 RepID=A0ABY6WGH2_9BURK|nr:hypothetical protein PPN31119_01161 [Pandoraea pnomenusa]